MSTAARLITAEEFFTLPESVSGRCELLDGEVVTMAPPGAMHGFVAMRLGSILERYVTARESGAVFGNDTGFVTARNPDQVLAPDVAFVRRERIAAVGIPKTYFPEAPALVVEVVSPNEMVSEVTEKVVLWLAAGVELVWVVEWKGKTITAYRSQTDIEIFAAKDTLLGDPLVPGFSCRVSDIFPDS